MCSAVLCTYSAELDFLFGIQKSLRAFLNSLFTSGVVTVSCICSAAFCESAALREKGFAPYYLYRQKYMSGSFENVGWSRDNLDCLYNIYMMEEVHTILSLGGGGMNKVNLPDGTLRRFHNPKFPEQYIEMLPGVLEQKQELFRLMADGAK